jgi:hypothetical protein
MCIIKPARWRAVYIEHIEQHRSTLKQNPIRFHEYHVRTAHAWQLECTGISGISESLISELLNTSMQLVRLAIDYGPRQVVRTHWPESASSAQV